MKADAERKRLLAHVAYSQLNPQPIRAESVDDGQESVARPEVVRFRRLGRELEIAVHPGPEHVGAIAEYPPGVSRRESVNRVRVVRVILRQPVGFAAMDKE